VKTPTSVSRWSDPVWVAGLLAGACLLGAGCGAAGQTTTPAVIPSALLREARPIGRGPRFHPPARGIITGRCQGRLGRRYGVHVEVFGANRVVILPAGIGTRPPRRLFEGRISSAGCYGNLVTLEPTGLILVRPGSHPDLEELFRAWGQPLSPRRLAGFSAPPHGHVRVFIDGRPRPGSPDGVQLSRHAEIVLELGPYVPPHHSYTFPPGT
jgi:hypothetical protein